MIPFFKATACGNDYVYIDTRDCDDLVKKWQKRVFFAKIIDTEFQLENDRETAGEFVDFVKKVSDRHFGVGSDGVVIISKSEVASAKMTIFNSDGSRGKICGNALRVVAAYLSQKSGKNNYFTVETDSGIKKTFSKPLKNSNFKYYSSVCLGKAECKNPPERIISILQNRLKNKYNFVLDVNTGNDHLVIGLNFVKPDRKHPKSKESIQLYGINAEKTDRQNSKNEENSLLYGINSKKVFYQNLAESLQKEYPGGINVHFAMKSENAICVKHYERGSGFTLSCGSGATAVAKAFLTNGFFSENEKIKVVSDGGEVFVLSHGGEFFLSGQVEFVFSGEILFD